MANLPESTTTSKHTATPKRDDDETKAQVNFITHTIRNLVEDELKRYSPSSCTVFTAAESLNMRKRHAYQHETSRKPTFTRTTTPLKQPQKHLKQYNGSVQPN